MQSEDELEGDGQLAKTWQALSPSDPDDDKGMEVDDQMPTGAARIRRTKVSANKRLRGWCRAPSFGFAKPLSSVGNIEKSKEEA